MYINVKLNFFNLLVLFTHISTNIGIYIITYFKLLLCKKISLWLVTYYKTDSPNIACNERFFRTTETTLTYSNNRVYATEYCRLIRACMAYVCVSVVAPELDLMLCSGWREKVCTKLYYRLSYVPRIYH